MTDYSACWFDSEKRAIRELHACLALAGISAGRTDYGNDEGPSLANTAEEDYAWKVWAVECLAPDSDDRREVCFFVTVNGQDVEFLTIAEVVSFLQSNGV